MTPTPEKKKKTDAKTSPASAISPRRKAGARPTRLSVSRVQTARYTLVCIHFRVLPTMEAYGYWKDANNDGFTNGYKQYASNRLESPALSQANFVDFKFRRVPESDNITLMDSHNYPRCLFVRYLQEDETSTPTTRAQGLAVLSAFFMDPNNSRYPPAAITTTDITNDENPPSLDQFFMDNDIIQFIQTDLDPNDLTNEFFVRFPVLAHQLWAGQNYPDYARSLGFP
jgi:hypothetical protein